MPRSPPPRETHTVTADRGGRRRPAWTRCPFGIAAWRLGAGRARAEDPVIHAAGIDLHVKPGDAVARRSAAVHPARPTMRRGSSARSTRSRARGRSGADAPARAPARPRAHHGLTPRHPIASTHRTDTRTARATPAPRRHDMPIDQHGDATLAGRLDPRACPRCRCTTTSTAACGPRRSSSSATRSASTLPETDADALADWFAEKSDSGLARGVPEDVRPHDRGHADRARGSPASRASSSRTSPPTA